MNGFQVEIQDMNGIFRFPEADELGMTGIAFCLSLQNFACQEAFPPPGQPGRQHPGKRGGVTRVSCFLDSERPYLVVLNCVTGKKAGELSRVCFLWGKGVSYLSPGSFFISMGCWRYLSLSG